MASPDANDQLGGILEEGYGGDKPQDLHIDQFYLIIGKEFKEKSAEVIAKLQQTSGIKVLGTLEPKEWPEFLIVEFPKRSSDETERQREERLNDTIRKPLLITLAQDPSSPPRILIGRVCKYTKSVAPKNDINTLDVETALMSPFDQHMDYFYLFIRSSVATTAEVPIMDKIRSTWKMLAPEGTWPLTLIGYFPKKQFESEREREWRLNKEVREPLKKEIEAKIKQESQQQADSVEKLVYVLFTRVCKYTNM